MPGTCWDPMDCNEGNPLNEGETPSVSQPRARAVLGSIPAPSPGRQVPDTGTSPSAPSPQRVPAVTPCHLLGSQAGPQVPQAPPGPCPTQASTSSPLQQVSSPGLFLTPGSRSGVLTCLSTLWSSLLDQRSVRRSRAASAAFGQELGR